MGRGGRHRALEPEGGAVMVGERVLVREGHPTRYVLLGRRKDALSLGEPQDDLLSVVMPPRVPLVS